MESHALYYSQLCYFCQKVFKHLHGRQTSIEARDVHDAKHSRDLMKGGGKGQVPCLRIERETSQGKTQVQWLYESDDIIAYIEKNKLVE